MTEVEQAIVLIKAWPQPSKRYGETVCCAGVTREGKWRRLFPVRFRHLVGDAKFQRWDILEYKPRQPRDDSRAESRRVEEDSLKVVGAMPKRERAAFFEKLVRPSFSSAAAAGESLSLIRPTSLQFKWRRRADAEMAAEIERRDRALAQGDLFDADLKKLEICPYNLRMTFNDGDGEHAMMCGHWETSYTILKWRKHYGDDRALEMLKTRYEQEYLQAGVCLALGTVKKRPKQWTLLGIIRLDEASAQGALF